MHVRQRRKALGLEERGQLGELRRKVRQRVEPDGAIELRRHVASAVLLDHGSDDRSVAARDEKSEKVDRGARRSIASERGRHGHERGRARMAMRPRFGDLSHLLSAREEREGDASSTRAVGGA